MAGTSTSAEMHRAAVGLDLLPGQEEAAARVVDVGQHGGPAKLARNQPMAAARVGIVLGIVAGEADRDVVGRIELDRRPGGPDVAIVILQAGGEVVAEALAAEPGDRAADLHAVHHRARGAEDQVELLIGADVGAGAEARLVGETAGDVLDRAADRVAAVERALRPAQHLDPLDVVNVEHGRLRAVEEDVVEIEADARLEAGDRILLADAADEGGQRGVGAARGLQRDVGRGVGDVGEVDRALALERLALISGDGDRHVDQIFRPTPGRDDDVLLLGRAAFVERLVGGGGLVLLRGVGLRRGILGLRPERGRSGGDRGDRGAEAEGGLHRVAVHGGVS
jgi:hypothetical protein